LPTHSDIDSLVKSKFAVKDSYQLPDGELEFKVEYRPDSKSNFEQLFTGLAGSGLVPWLSGTRNECVLTLRKAAVSPGRSRIPVLVALFTLGSILVFSLLERQLFALFAPGVSGYQVPVQFASTVILILGAHELGHRFASRRGGSSAPRTYLVPGIPGVTSFLPSLGPVSSQSGPELNRDRLFDVMSMGPLLALAVTTLLYAIGDVTSVASGVQVGTGQFANSTITINSNLLQMGVDFGLGPLVPAVPLGHFLLSPIIDGATIGFVLTFVAFLPMAHYDGGYLSSLAWGSRASRVATYLSVLLLIVLDTPNYWALGIFVLLIAGRPLQLQLLDEVSGLAARKKWLYVAMLILAALCLPLPQNVATLPLG
jgi:hypothetical protein